jgi:hypothetical protein
VNAGVRGALLVVRCSLFVVDMGGLLFFVKFCEDCDYEAFRLCGSGNALNAERSFSVTIAANEAESRKLAQVVISPDLAGFTAIDYLKAYQLSDRGYAAAEQQKASLLKYAVSDAQWNE